MKRGTFITGKRAKPLEGPLKEAAKYLRDAAARFVHDRANVGDVEVAITEWRSAVAEQAKGGG